MKSITWVKMALAGGVMCIGGPALILWISPTEEELFLKYNPDLQRKSLENRRGKQEDFDRFVKNLKRLSRSDRHIWMVQEEEASRLRKEGILAELERRREEEERRVEIRDSLKTK